MPGHTKQQLSVIKAKIEMYNRYKLIMNRAYDQMFVHQPQMYIISDLTPDIAPSVIKVQVIWNSKTMDKHVSFSRALRSQENYDRSMKELLAIIIYALSEAQQLGTSPFQELL